MENFIELIKINLTYNRDKDNAYQALFDINLKIKRGEFVVIFGPSGCGKSSLLNIMAGIENPDEGEVVIDNRNILIMKEKEKVSFHCNTIGMIFQSYNLIPTLNVLDNVALPQMFNDVRKKEREIRAMEVLKRFGIDFQWKRIPTELSGGQQQRIGIARAIVNNPEIILADEPIGNLDTKSANNVMEILGKLNREEKKTIVLVSHNPENIIWGTHIVYMKDGKIIKEEFKGEDEVRMVESRDHSRKSEFDIMLERLNGLSGEQVALMMNPMKAKAITESLLIPYEKNQTDIMESNIGRYLLDKIGIEQLMEVFDKDSEVGGAGLDIRSAKRFSDEVENITRYARAFVREVDLDKKVFVVLKYIIKKLEINIKDEEIMLRLANLIKAKISNKIDHIRFRDILDNERENGGIGLDKRVVKKIAKELSLFLIVSYGAKPIGSSYPQEDRQEERKDDANAQI